MKKDTRILILSVSAWSSKTGADTWPTLVEGHDPQHVASLSLRDDAPDSPAADHYFRISETLVLRSILKRSTKTGARVERSSVPAKTLGAHEKRYTSMKRNLVSLLGREAVWLLGRWKTPELRGFIEDFRPDVILYAMDGYIHLNRLCRYAKKLSKAKSIGFFVDDNFTYKQSPRLGDRIFRFFQRRSLRRLAKETDAFFAISEVTKTEADAFFGIDCTVLTKPLKQLPVFVPYTPKRPIRMLYTGNLGIGRDRSLLTLMRAIHALGEDASAFAVEVYTRTALSDERKAELLSLGCALHAPVPQSEVHALQKEADILLFLEDTDGPDARTARLSFSTKITDYLAAGKCILAVGCKDTAPMQYFEANGAALTAETGVEIRECLERILSDASLVSTVAEHAVLAGRKNHDKETVLQTFNRVISETLSGERNAVYEPSSR